MAVLTNISTIAAVTQVSAVEICFTTLTSVGGTSLLRTATFYHLNYSLRCWRQSSHHRKPFAVLQNFQLKYVVMVAGAGALCRYSKASLNSWLS